MSVDTLFDYLESAEGSKDLGALMAGELSGQEIRELCHPHGVDRYTIIRIAIRCQGIDNRKAV